MSRMSFVKERKNMSVLSRCKRSHTGLWGICKELLIDVESIYIYIIFNIVT